MKQQEKETRGQIWHKSLTWYFKWQLKIYHKIFHRIQRMEHIYVRIPSYLSLVNYSRWTIMGEMRNDPENYDGLGKVAVHCRTEDWSPKLKSGNLFCGSSFRSDSLVPGGGGVTISCSIFRGTSLLLVTDVKSSYFFFLHSAQGFLITNSLGMQAPNQYKASCSLCCQAQNEGHVN